MRNPKILVFSGSSRSGSLNGKLAALVKKHLVLSDAEVTHISLNDYPMPLYDGDLEATTGVPAHAQKLKKLFEEQDGVFIACPEYNSGITPLLKNTLDWISRAKDGNTRVDGPFKGKVFAVGAASPGAFGGMRGLISVRTILEVGLGALVIPEMVSVTRASTAFDAKGDLADERAAKQLQMLAQALLRHTRIQLSI
ncbi:NAD(P)H-dependent FMN reductase [Roseibium hamelinense]|uniref:NAD(P)H-dependent FMN reductase n=1 Tax=Roseibium hamelinense TaxID=150831 RepID=A0A562T137_9HYPH|nr:NAD(P)H-dependent oxidoreductase [Roseibium hamelinense]MTI44682.1 NADPH-dependent oxidoreductase [Roseibium hamelinense]TWI87311.1 NAD(P)H-dependent FMN reductase [Roseibium hamelinense]